MVNGYTFSELSEVNKERAIARFFNAGTHDGFLYELDSVGQLMSRKKATLVLKDKRVKVRLREAYDGGIKGTP